MKEFNILFTSPGRRVSLVKHFKNTLSELNLKGKILTADLKKNAPAHFVSDKNFFVSKVNDQNYISKIIEICEKEQIHLLIPLIDSELHILAAYKEEFVKRGIYLLVSSNESNKICFDKRNTNQFFNKINAPTPSLIDPNWLLNSSQQKFPYFLKPADGSCSIGATKINNIEELRFFLLHTPKAIVQEYIEGQEYTCDVLVDFKGKVRCIVPRLRIETRAGEVSKSMTVKNRFIISETKKVVENLPGAIGCITVQCFLTLKNEIKFIEINPRFGGGFPLSIASGANYPKWIIQWILGEDPEINLEGWTDRLVMLRYDEAIFINESAIT